MFAQGLSPLAVESNPQTSTQKPVEYISPIQQTTNQTSNQSGLPNGTPQYDKFGVLKIYPTKNAGEEWLMDMDNLTLISDLTPKRRLLEIPMALGR